MFKDKLKRVLGVTLATVMAFSGMTVTPISNQSVVEVEAAAGEVYDSAFYRDERIKDLDTMVYKKSSDDIRFQTSRSFLWYPTGLGLSLGETEDSFYYLTNYSYGVSEITFTDTKTSIDWTGYITEASYHDKIAFNYSPTQAEHREFIVLGLRPVKGVESIFTDEISLPAYVDTTVAGKSVTAKCMELAPYALAGGQFSKVKIPDTYQRICDGAFAQCTDLTSVIFVDSEDFTKVVDGSSLHALGSYAFAGCSSLTEPLILENLFRYRGVVIRKGDLPTSGGREGYMEYPHINAQGVMSEKEPSYYMGTGVYQDCTSLQKVVFTGTSTFKEVYVPEDTFAGCSSLNELSINSIDKIVIGKAAFAGSVGVGGNQLKRLEFNCDVVLDCFAFTNCYNLEEVIFHKSFNKIDDLGYDKSSVNTLDYNLYNAYSASGLNWGNFYGIFKDSFKKEGSRIEFHAEEGDTLILPNGFLEGATGLETIDFSGAEKATVKIDKFALKKVKCNKLSIKGSSIDIHPGAFYGFYGKELELDAIGRITIHGEVFADTCEYSANTPRASESNNTLERIILNGKVVYYSSSAVSSALKHTDGTYSLSLKQKYSNAHYYSVGEGTELYYGESVERVEGDLKDVVVYDVSDSKTSTTSVKHEALGGIKNVYVTSPRTQFYKDTLYLEGSEDYNLYGFVGVNVLGSTETVAYSALAKTSSNINFQEYITDLSVRLVKDVVNTDFNKGFKPEYLKVTAHYAGSFDDKILEYAGDDVSENEAVDGYVLTEKTRKYFESEEYRNVTEPKDIDIQVTYNNIISDRITTVVKPKKLDGYTVELKESAKLVEGCTVSVSDLEITNLVYNDGEISPVLTGEEEVSVVVNNNDSPLVIGENTVVVDVNGIKKELKVIANPKAVVTMSAVVVNKVYEGEILEEGDFKVTAYYDNGTVDEDFKDFVVLTKDKLTLDTKFATVVLKDNENIASIVNLDVIALEPVAIVAEYTGSDIEVGNEVSKEDIKAYVLYNSGAEEELSSEDFTLAYRPIKEGDNEVNVILNSDNTKQKSVIVKGKPAPVKETATPEPSKEVETTATPEPTKETATPEPSKEVGTTATPEPSKEAESTVTPEPSKETVTPEPSKEVEKTSTPEPSKEAEKTATPEPSEEVGTSSGNNKTEENESNKSDKTGETKVPETSSTPSPTPVISSTPAVPTTPIANGVTPTIIPVVGAGTQSGQVVVGTTKEYKITLGIKEKLPVKLTSAIKAYNTTNNKVATVSPRGIITAKKLGKATIIINDESGTELKINVVVKKAPKKVNTNFKKKVLKVGKEIALKAKFVKGYYSNKIKFSSSNKKVATVTSKGVIEAKKKGTCKITLKTYNGKKVTVKISVR